MSNEDSTTKLIVDTREKEALKFGEVTGVEIVRGTLSVGDYGAVHVGESGEERSDEAVVERKSVADLFNSFTARYDEERAKIIRAKEAGLQYILAIEAPILEVRKGHSYWKDGQMHEARKDGLSMIRQISTIERKYGVTAWYCMGRADMAFRIVEFFLARERVKP